MTPFIAAIFLGLTCFAQSPRTTIPFNHGWRFFRGDDSGAVAAQFHDASWERICLPHTWNANDAVPGKDFFVGAGWYRKHFSAPSDLKQRRVFVRFEAASLMADVYLNGAKLAEHEGGFAAFTIELTPYLCFGGQNCYPAPGYFSPERRP